MPRDLQNDRWKSLKEIESGCLTTAAADGLSPRLKARAVAVAPIFWDTASPNKITFYTVQICGSGQQHRGRLSFMHSCECECETKARGAPDFPRITFGFSNPNDHPRRGASGAHGSSTTLS